MRVFRVLIADFSIRTAYTRKWRRKNLSFQYVVQNDMVNNFCYRTYLGFITVRTPEFFEVQRLNLPQCFFDRNFQKIISPCVLDQITWLFFYFVDIVEENMGKIKRNF